MKNHRQSQSSKIMELLENGFIYHKDGWVNLYVILGLHIASHTRRIHELRKAGHNIEMRSEWVDGQRRTAYRLVKV